MPPTRVPLLALSFTCSALIVGCQRYSPDPLRLDVYHEGLGARDPSASAVVAYAKRLGQSSTAGPTQYDPADGVSMREAEVLALFFNPHLRAARLRARVPAASAAEAGRWEDPELRVDAERIIESVEHPWVIGGVLELTIPLSGRLAAEKDRALADAAAAQLAVLAEERRLLAELRAAWLDWSAEVERVALTRRCSRSWTRSSRRPRSSAPPASWTRSTRGCSGSNA